MTDQSKPRQDEGNGGVAASLTYGLLAEAFAAGSVIVFQTSHFIYQSTARHAGAAPTVSALWSAAGPALVAWLLALNAWRTAGGIGGLLRWLPVAVVALSSIYCAVLAAAG